MGDFNIDMNRVSHDRNSLISFVESGNMFLVPYDPTHHIRDSSTAIDLGIVDNKNKIMGYGQHDVNFLSAHDLIYIKYNIKIDRVVKRFRLCRDYTKLDKERLADELAAVCWDPVLREIDMEKKVDLFNKLLTACFDTVVPKKRVMFKKVPAPWLTDDIKEEMPRRDRARRTWRRRRSEESLRLYKSLRNYVQTRMREIKTAYYTTAFRNLKDSALVWNKLRHLGLISNRRGSGRLLFQVEELNTFFVDSISANGMVQDLTIEYGDQGGYNDNKLYWRYEEPLEIEKAIKKTKSLSTGGDDIRLLKIVLPYILHIIENIFNASLIYGVFPVA